MTDLLKGANVGLSEVMKIAKALNKKDYIQVLLIFIDIDLNIVKNQNPFISLSLEELRPALRFLRDTLQILCAQEGSQYYHLKLKEKLKILFKSLKKNAEETRNVACSYFKKLVEDAKSGKLKKRFINVVQKMIKTKKALFGMLLKKLKIVF